MFLSTLFLSEIENGAEYAIAKCNDEYMKRLASIQNGLSAIVAGSKEKEAEISDLWDEMMALWDVFYEFEVEILIILPIINVMNTIRTARALG